MSKSITEDQDVLRLKVWAKQMNIDSNQFNYLCAIVEVTVKHKLQEFAEEFMKLTINEMIEEQKEMIDEKQKKTGLWS